MEEKENICVEFVQPNGAEAQEKEESGLGKFKDVDALLKAYGCLQAEFTRRSQRLKELEREAENRRKAEKLSEEGAKPSGVEKLLKMAKVRKEESVEFDAFVEEIERENGKTQAKEVREIADRESETEGAGMRINASEVENGEVESGKQTEFDVAEKAQNVSVKGEETTAMQTERNGSSVQSVKQSEQISSCDLYNLAMKDEGVRLKIIGDYFSSLKKNGAPLTVGGAGAPVAPPLKARSINDAGNLALKWFQKEKVK